MLLKAPTLCAVDSGCPGIPMTLPLTMCPATGAAGTVPSQTRVLAPEPQEPLQTHCVGTSTAIHGWIARWTQSSSRDRHRQSLLVGIGGTRTPETSQLALRCCAAPWCGEHRGRAKHCSTASTGAWRAPGHGEHCGTAKRQGTAKRRSSTPPLCCSRVLQGCDTVLCPHGDAPRPFQGPTGGDAAPAAHLALSTCQRLLPGVGHGNGDLLRKPEKLLLGAAQGHGSGGVGPSLPSGGVEPRGARAAPDRHALAQLFPFLSPCPFKTKQ